MTPEPGAYAFEKLAAAVDGFGLLREALEKIAENDERRAKLSKAAAVRAGELERELSEAVALLPRARARRHLEADLLQIVKTLHEERGWGRDRILEETRDRGGTEWKVRRALAELAGEKSGSSTRSR